jgi:thiol-disulfide isomerase/thioredoxin
MYSSHPYFRLTIILLLLSQQAYTQSTFSGKAGITPGEIRLYIDSLSKRPTPDAKRQLEAEAETLRKADTEALMMLASDIYLKHLQKTDSAQKIKAGIIARYPNGKTARDQGVSKLLSLSRKQSVTAAELESAYDKWLAQFPKEHFDKKDLDMYATAAYTLAEKHLAEQHFDRSANFTAQLRGSYLYALQVCNFMYAWLKEKKDVQKHLALLEDAYHLTVTEAQSNPTTVTANVKFLYNLASLYAQVLTKLDRLEEAIAIGNKIVTETHYKDFQYYNGDKITDDTKLLAGNYLRAGNKQKAISVYENYLLVHPGDSNIITEMTPVYKDLYGSEADIYQHLSGIDNKGQQEAYDKLKATMIRKKAPAFSLLDRKGKKVSLSDYKGKIVVLDFWATWCVPCLQAFPGMQAAIDKYSGNPDIVFLFINTWEREENYKESVDELITRHNYRFHVLFDDTKGSTASAYAINGVPTQIMIDKKGYIRFQDNSGGNNTTELIRDLDTKILLIKQE